MRLLSSILMAIASRHAVWMLLLLFSLSTKAKAQENTNRINPVDLYAAFLTKFPYFVEWPTRPNPTSDPHIRIGILGKDVFDEDTIISMGQQKFNGTPLKVLKFNEIDQIRPVDILYVGNQFANQTAKVIAATKGKGILTVAATPDFAERGGMIHFITEKNRVRFVINLREAKEENIRISAQLLRTARVLR